MVNVTISTLMAAYMTAVASQGEGFEPVAPPIPIDSPPITLNPPSNSCEAIVAGNGETQSKPQDLPKEKIHIQTDKGIVVIDAEIARTPEEQEIGLMYREDIPDGTGMLFIDVPKGENGEIGVWMKDTYAPLDILFLDKDGNILSVHKNAPPCDFEKIMGGKDAVSILELPAGSADLYGIESGDKIDMPAQEEAKPDKTPIIMTKPDRPRPARPEFLDIITSITP